MMRRTVTVELELEGEGGMVRGGRRGWGLGVVREGGLNMFM